MSLLIEIKLCLQILTKDSVQALNIMILLLIFKVKRSFID